MIKCSGKLLELERGKQPAVWRCPAAGGAFDGGAKAASHGLTGAERFHVATRFLRAILPHVHPTLI